MSAVPRYAGALLLAQGFVVHSRNDRLECAQRLADLLRAGAQPRVDGRRPSIFDLADGADVYCFHVHSADRVELLACRHGELRH